MKDSVIDRPPFVIAALEAAWPGVRVKTFRIHVDRRPVTGNPGDRYADCMSIEATISGSPAALVEAGLVLPHEFPARGKRKDLGSHCISLTMGAHTARLNAFLCESHETWPVKQRIVDRMAPIVVSTVWQPSRTA